MKVRKVILLVDDEFIILESLKIQLKKLAADDVEIETASSGEEALELLNDFANEQVDLILVICDYNLGDMLGLDVLSKVTTYYPDAHQAILTGQANLQGTQLSEYVLNLTAIIEKPWASVDLSNLLTIVFTDT